MKQSLFNFSFLLLCAPSLFAETGYFRGNVVNGQGAGLSGARLQLIDSRRQSSGCRDDRCRPANSLFMFRWVNTA